MTRPFLWRFVVLLAEPSLSWTLFNSMLAPRRPNNPVLVLERHLVRRNNPTISYNSNGKRRAGLVGEDGVRRQRLGETMKWMNGTTKSAGRAPQEQPRPTTLVLSASGAPTTQTTYAVSMQSTPSPVERPEGGAKVEIESLPGQNQNRPNWEETKILPQVLPGVNQDTSNMGEVPKLVAAAAPKPSSAPAITVNRPLPGQNQANPIVGELAPPPVPSLPAAASLPSQPPPLPPPTSSRESAPSPTSGIPTSLVHTVTISTTVASSTTPMPVSILTSSERLAPSATTSFLTITRSEQGKEESKATLALSSALPLSVSETSVGRSESATPQAIAAAQSISGVISATTAIATTTLTPTVLPSNQDGSILHPTARTLLILFVILGAFSILVAVVVIMMTRSHRKRFRAQQQTKIEKHCYDASLGVTTHISASPNDNPFLTASEKAIIDRAAAVNGTIDAIGSSSFSDAISSFIKKSRRMTYKISP